MAMRLPDSIGFPPNPARCSTEHGGDGDQNRDHDQKRREGAITHDELLTLSFERQQIVVVRRS